METGKRIQGEARSNAREKVMLPLRVRRRASVGRRKSGFQPDSAGELLARRRLLFPNPHVGMIAERPRSAVMNFLRTRDSITRRAHPFLRSWRFRQE